MMKTSVSEYKQTMDLRHGIKPTQDKTVNEIRERRKCVTHPGHSYWNKHCLSFTRELHMLRLPSCPDARSPVCAAQTLINR